MHRSVLKQATPTAPGGVRPDAGRAASELHWGGIASG
jgi:hypothetical protein